MMRKLAKQTKEVTKNVQDGVRAAFRGGLNLVKSGSDIQQVQVSGLADETIQDLELMQHFGFTSVPPAGTQAVVIPWGGKTTHGIIVATENGSFRVKNLKNGEVAIYDSSGSTIILKNNRVIDVECDAYNVKCKTYQVTASEGATINGDLTQAAGSFSTSGDVTASGDVSANGTSLSTHKHNEQGDGRPTSAPI
ncbi:phage baseplate assembly protein V [Actinobacillus minor]|uniref:phage baseplate assembly protein V n=1 Tax=Actinobacillus minor TaxID=51047 RepID=UPI0023F19B48|nr:phage baseplate assembly protein V [Actinobacillus minor]MDD6911321.1 phage baseplate assembly protein V [Actinobacillus minor]MDY4713782.1 phage baseplate assembly protein V [Actinobacillus minor]